MSFGGSLAILWFLLLMLAASLVVLAVMGVGGALVGLVSVPLLFVLPSVRRRFVTLAEHMFDAEVESLTDPRFLGTYALAVAGCGIGLVIFVAAVAEALRTAALPLTPFIAFTTVFLMLFASGALLADRRVATRSWVVSVGEWMVFLCFLAGLTLVAVFVVPIGLSKLVGFFL